MTSSRADEGAGPAPSVQTDYDKIRRIPFLYAFNAVNTAALLCTIGAPLALYAAELGIEEGRIGILAGILPFAQLFCIVFLPLVMQFSQRIITAMGYGFRHLFLLSWFAAPWLASPEHAFWLLFASISLFALLRTLAETAIWPWSQEYMPRQIRGRVNGLVALIALPVALAGSLLIQLWLDSRTGIDRFFPVFVVGIVLGLSSVLFLLGLKGGQPRPGSPRQLEAIRAMKGPLKNRQFWLYLYSSGTQYFAFTAVSLFLLLFFRERLQLTSGQLVALSAFMPLGGAVGSVVTGWFIDRYGTRAIRVSLQSLQVVLLLSLLLVGEPASGKEILAGAIFFLAGLLFQSSILAGGIYLLNYVPPAEKENYMTLAYAGDGLIGGGATVLAGILLQILHDQQAVFFGVPIDSYGFLFVLTAIIVVTSAVAFALLREDDATGVMAFLGYFRQGSAIRALLSVRRFDALASEERRQELTYTFGATRSAFVKEELIEALSDPSFDVRYEAIQALGHLPPSAPIVRALETMLDPAGLAELQYAALASLGRCGDTESAPHVAQFLESPNPLLRARAIRTLGSLGDAHYLPAIRTSLREDRETDCRIAAVSALGKYRDRESVPGLVEIYRELVTADPGGKGEARSRVVLLALAKVLGHEDTFSREWRLENRQPGSRLPRLAARLARAMRRLPGAEARAVARELTATIEDLGAGQTARAFAALEALSTLIAGHPHPDSAIIQPLLRAGAEIRPTHSALIILLTLALNNVLVPVRQAPSQSAPQQ